MADSPSAVPYRPVSPPAVVGFGLAVMSVLVIGGMAVVSLWSGKPTLSGFGSGFFGCFFAPCPGASSARQPVRIRAERRRKGVDMRGSSLVGVCMRS